MNALRATAVAIYRLFFVEQEWMMQSPLPPSAARMAAVVGFLLGFLGWIFYRVLQN